jgi:hypothetical protein
MQSLYCNIKILKKLDGLQWHASCYMATNALPRVKTSEYYFSLNNQHARNEKDYVNFHGHVYLA